MASRQLRSSPGLAGLGASPCQASHHRSRSASGCGLPAQPCLAKWQAAAQHRAAHQQHVQPPQPRPQREGWQQAPQRHRRGPPPRAAADDLGGAAAAASSSDGEGLQARLAGAAAWLDALYRFSRPHTMLGTAVSVCSVSALALAPGQMGGAALRAFLQALSSALLMNVCIVGINQLYDIEIDRVNKPYLPLAAGDFSPATGRALVWASGAASLAIGASSASPPLLATLGGSLLLGIAYSTDMPLLRWKRSPLLAAACILAVRAVLVQLGFFFHMQLALGSGAPAVTRPIAFATAFMLLFSVVIALFKDIPDIAGDKQAGVRTLSVRLGPRRVFWACIAILEAAYAGAILVGLQSELVWSRVATTAAHAALGVLLLRRAARTDLSSPRDISRAYMFSWGLFYAEYLLLPLFR